MSQEFTNIIIFGESGVGKSSVINMVAGKDVTKTSSDARGCTFASNAYDVDISGTKFRLFDTAGLNEITTVKPMKALESLFTLIWSLQDGVSLLVYVTRGRVKDSTLKNYRLFYEMLCEEKVPVVLVITGLEFEDPMDSWWTRNGSVFTEHNMHFHGHACITAIRGRSRNGRFLFQEEYEESREKVRQLIRRHRLNEPLKTDPNEWSLRVAKKIWNTLVEPFRLPPIAYSSSFGKAIFNYGGFRRKEAVMLSNDAVDAYLERFKKTSNR